MDNPGPLALPTPSRPAGRAGVSSRAPAVHSCEREKPAKPMALVSQPDRPVMRDNDGTKSAPPRRAGKAARRAFCRTCPVTRRHTVDRHHPRDQPST